MIIMKKSIIILSAVLIASFSFAQGGGFNYKALITENGNVLATHPVTIQFTVLENGATSIYQETQTTNTDDNGIISVSIGEGTAVLGSFDTIDWGSNSNFLKVEIDTGTGFQDFGTTELKAVPYAKYAEKAGNSFSGDYNDLSNKPVLFYEGLTNNPATDDVQDIRRTGSIVVGFDFTNATSNALIRINSRSSENDDVYGFGAAIGGDGSGRHYGGQFVLLDAGEGTQYGVSSTISNTGNGTHYAYYASLNGSGTGPHYGNYNILYGGGIGTQIGNYNKLTGDGTGEQYGSVNYINNSGDNTHYAIHNILSGTGSGDKYGSYNKIEVTAGGTHYAVYGEAEKSGSYAGYFVGDIYTTQKITSPDSGDTDMKAYIYGSITSAGYFSSLGAHSDGFTVTKTSDGIYKIDFTGSNAPTSSSSYTVMTNMRYSNIGFITVQNYSTYFTINTYDISGNPTDKAFNFVVYKK